MILQHLNCLEKHKNTSTRSAAILKVENNYKTHPSLIKNLLKIKYGLEEEVTKNKLEESQLANLYNEIKNLKLHSIVNDSLRGLKKRSVRPPDQECSVLYRIEVDFRSAEGIHTQQLNLSNGRLLNNKM
ncbi:hypothetical protein CWI36_0898p0010 [Hamiltosporidium magnivora]|uniref:Uncharacterized protein n=1 Tax=Hamiltosporidium magnivora TaxID=148818 RepID=A0A4Q9L7D6_9MICR|nr:hypothetical protein CWI36_0898p0010 [Hamiltosporidium magnivora]